MQRDIDGLKNQEFDVLIIGAGSHGACAARDAALRGLSVALIDKGDIGGATSHNSLKTIHGGIRYLQHLNFKRTLESIKEQKIWLRTAPHLVKPLPFIMPTYGHGLRGPLAMFAGLTLFKLLGIGRNKHLRDDRKLPAGRIMSKAQCLELAPDIATDDLTGAALWYDAQVEQSDRAVMQVAEAASQLGAVMANYVSASKLLISDNGEMGATVVGAAVKDELTSAEFTIQARTVINAAGPWAAEILKVSPALETNFALTKNMNLVTDLPATASAIAVQSTLQSDSVLGDTKRLYFMVPWLGQLVVGTTHFRFTGKPDELSINSAEILGFVDEINAAYPSLKLKPENILYCYQGLLPAGEELAANTHQSATEKNAIQLHESKVIDHVKDNKVQSLVSILSVKWTTARLVAEQAIDIVAKKLGHHTQGRTDTEPLIDHLDLPHETHELTDEQLVEFCHAHIQHSMTVSLEDLVLRRTNDLVLGKLTAPQVRLMAHTMQQHFKWNAHQLQQQIDLLLANWLPNELRENLQHTSTSTL